MRKKIQHTIVHVSMALSMFGIGGCQSRVRESKEPKNNYAEEFNRIQTLKKLAASGDAKAQFDLGIIYLEEKETGKDLGKAIKWLEVAANQGNGEASWKLFYIYFNEYTKTKDMYYFEKAKQWGNLAAKQGVHEAQDAIAWNMIMFFRETKKTEFFESAIFWLSKAIEGNSFYAATMLSGMLWEDWDGTLENEGLVHLLQKMIEIGKDERFRTAIMECLAAYFWGNAMIKAPSECEVLQERSLQLLREAGERGGKFAQWMLATATSDMSYLKENPLNLEFDKRELGEIFAKKQSILKNKISSNESFYWIKKIAESGEPEFVNLLAICYFTGDGTKEDRRKARELLLKVFDNPTAKAELKKNAEEQLIQHTED